MLKNKHSTNSKLSKNDSNKKSDHYKLIGESGVEYYLKRIIGRGTFGVVYEAYTSDNISEEETEDSENNTEEISDEEINEWINNNDVYSKAGAYAIQENFGKHIKRIDGDYFAIVGLSINQVYHLLKKYL